MAIIFLIGSQLNPDFFYRATHGGNVLRLGGLIINPNELGLLSIIGITLSYVEIYFNKNKRYNAFAILVCITVMLMTQSRSSLFAFLVISGLYLFISKNYYLKIVAVAIAIVTLPIVINKIVFKEGNIEEVTSMTGRTDFWSDLITEAFPLSPICGFGFMSISTNSFYNKYSSTHSYAASMAHNTFVEVLINLGLVGAFICLLQMLLTFFAIAFSKERVLQMMAFFMLVPLLINSITEFGIFGHTNYAIMFYQFVFLFFTITVVNRKENFKLNQQHLNK
jgi:O-antigen ligase